MGVFHNDMMCDLKGQAAVGFVEVRRISEFEPPEFCLETGGSILAFRNLVFYVTSNFGSGEGRWIKQFGS